MTKKHPPWESLEIRLRLTGDIAEAERFVDRVELSGKARVLEPSNDGLREVVFNPKETQDYLVIDYINDLSEYFRVPLEWK